jgi:nucleoid-associated protein YgaU
VLPTVLRRVLAGAAGASVALAPVSALADPAPPVWPTTGPAVTADPQLPATPAVPVTPAAAAPPATRPVPALTVTVQPGDSLWLIAARGLGTAASPSRTAEAWPRWYAANRATVGPDPSLIHPGQQLTAPPDPEVNP